MIRLASLIIYIGNHGLEIQNPAGYHKKKLSPQREKELRMIARHLRNSFREVPGVLFKDKGPFPALHSRNVAQKYCGWIRRVLEETAKRWRDRWRIIQGKMIFEIQPRLGFHKGKALQEILKIFLSQRLLPIYLGDDQTDEEAFRELKGRGITVFVGPAWVLSEAEYHLKDPMEVRGFLNRFAQISCLWRPPFGVICL